MIEYVILIQSLWCRLSIHNFSFRFMSLQKIQWIKTEAIASNRSSRWRQKVKVSFKNPLLCFLNRIHEHVWNIQKQKLTFNGDGQTNLQCFFLLFTLFATNQQRLEEMQSCQSARQQQQEKNSLGAGWLYLACTLSRSPTEGFYVKSIFMPNEPTS